MEAQTVISVASELGRSASRFASAKVRLSSETPKLGTRKIKENAKLMHGTGKKGPAGRHTPYYLLRVRNIKGTAGEMTRQGAGYKKF